MILRSRARVCIRCMSLQTFTRCCMCWHTFLLPNPLRLAWYLNILIHFDYSWYFHDLEHLSVLSWTFFKLLFLDIFDDFEYLWVLWRMFFKALDCCVSEFMYLLRPAVSKQIGGDPLVNIWTAPPGKQPAQPVQFDGFWTVWKNKRKRKFTLLAMQSSLHT